MGKFTYILFTLLFIFLATYSARRESVTFAWYLKQQLEMASNQDDEAKENKSDADTSISIKKPIEPQNVAFDKYLGRSEHVDKIKYSSQDENMLLVSQPIFLDPSAPHLRQGSQGENRSSASEVLDDSEG